MNPIFYTDDGEGTPIVFIHGFCESHEIWSDFVAPIKKKFRVLTIDLPGFGNSQLPNKDISIDMIGAMVIEWISSLGISRVVIVGHSLGGYVALSIANQKPSILAGLVLFHSTAYADTNEKKASRNRVIEFVEKNGVPPYIETFVPGLFHQKDHESVKEVLKICLGTSPDTLIAYAMAMRDRQDRTDVLKDFTSPIMMVAGLKDGIIPIKSIEEQVAIIQNGTLVLLENSGHMGMFEEKNQAMDVITEFIHLCT